MNSFQSIQYSLYCLEYILFQFMNQVISTNSFIKSNYSLHVSVCWAQIENCVSSSQKIVVSVFLLHVCARGEARIF